MAVSPRGGYSWLGCHPVHAVRPSHGCGATARLGVLGGPARTWATQSIQKLHFDPAHRRRGLPQGERIRAGWLGRRFRAGWFLGLGLGGEPYGSSRGPRGLGLTVWSLPCGEAGRNKYILSAAAFLFSWLAGWPVGWDWLLPGVTPIQVQAH
jgi:hypothetical protein